MKPDRLPGETLTVVIRDPSNFLIFQDPPTYRSVSIKLTDEQRQALRLRCVGHDAGGDHFEDVCRCFIEPASEAGK